MDEQRPQRRRIRLALDIYAEVGAICSITIAVKGRFKNLVQREAWRLGVTGAFWQASFWDHFLRKDEQLEHLIEYVLDNPVRSGLVQRWGDYRFSGSLVLKVVDPGGGQAPALRVRPVSQGRPASQGG